MSLKPNGEMCLIKEQIVEDPLTGLTFQFERWEGQSRLRIYGDNLPYGNREIIFDEEGHVAGAGTLLVKTCPGWLHKVST